jgi:hypothetical protein
MRGEEKRRGLHGLVWGELYFFMCRWGSYLTGNTYMPPYPVTGTGEPLTFNLFPHRAALSSIANGSPLTFHSEVFRMDCGSDLKPIHSLCGPSAVSTCCRSFIRGFSPIDQSSPFWKHSRLWSDYVFQWFFSRQRHFNVKAWACYHLLVWKRNSSMIHELWRNSIYFAWSTGSWILNARLPTVCLGEEEIAERGICKEAREWHNKQFYTTKPF